MTNNVHNIDIHYNNGTGIQHQSNTVVNPYANQYARTNQNAIDEDVKGFAEMQANNANLFK